MKIFKKEKIKLTPVKLTLIITLVMLCFYHFCGENFKFLQILELKMLDMRFNIRGQRSPDNNIVIVAIDDASIKTIGRWPWERSIHAELINLLKADGAKAIGFDILFSEPQETPETSNLRKLYQYYLSLPIAGQEPYGKDFANHIKDALRNADHDRRLAEAVKQSDNVVMLIVFQVFNGSDKIKNEASETLKDDESSDNDEPPAELLEHLVSSSGDKDVSVPDEVKANAFQYVIQDEMTEISDIPVGEKLSLPLASYCRNAKSLGSPNYFLDIDGSARWSNMVIGHKGRYYPSFALQLLKIFKDLNNNDIKLIQGKGILFGNQMIPLDKKGRLLINYYGPSEAVKYYPYISVIDKKLPPGTFKDKIVLVGYAATGVVDVLNTPFSDSMPGVEQHATVISNILQNDFLHRNTSSYFIDLIYIIFTGLLAGIAVSRFSALKGAWISILIFSIILISNYFAFSCFKTWINLVYPLLTLFIVSGSLILFKFFTEEKDRLFIKAIFGNYLTPDLIEEMCKNRIMPKLGGEARFITAYFTDIECFSSLSEKLTPEQLVELLNEYFSAMTDILINEKGTLDKYEGDAMVAFFGAPSNVPDHALRACCTAVEMQNKLSELREKWENEKQDAKSDLNTKNFPPEEWHPGYKWHKMVSRMRMRIGINTGNIVVGNIGSTKRMNYTMMGDSVNLAARLECACKHYGIYTLASEHTLNTEITDENNEKMKVGDMIETRYIDNIIVKGKSEPVKVYEILALKGNLKENEKELVQHFHEGMRYYFDMKWDKAIAEFEASLKLEHENGDAPNPSQVYIQRCKIYKDNPSVVSDEKWEGVFRLTKK